MSVSDDKIKEAEEIEKVREARKNLEDAVRVIPEIDKKYDKLITELCVGPDCLKNKVEDKFGQIDEKIKKMEERQSYFPCDECGYDRVEALSSYCPRCGSPIFKWEDDNGQPVKGWEHYSKVKG